MKLDSYFSFIFGLFAGLFFYSKMIGEDVMVSVKINSVKFLLKFVKKHSNIELFKMII